MKVLSSGKDNNGIRKVKINRRDAYLYKHGGGFKVVETDGIEITSDEPGETSCPHSGKCRNEMKIGKCTGCTRNEKDPRTKDNLFQGDME